MVGKKASGKWEVASGETQNAERRTPNAKDGYYMFLNLLCYILIELFDVFGVMNFFVSFLPFDDPDFFEPFE